jgi:hypothetical protein
MEFFNIDIFALNSSIMVNLRSTVRLFDFTIHTSKDMIYWNGISAILVRSFPMFVHNTPNEMWVEGLDESGYPKYVYAFCGVDQQEIDLLLDDLRNQHPQIRIRRT